jgi:betaine-homocysteine S-methyltransferase
MRHAVTAPLCAQPTAYEAGPGRLTSISLAEPHAALPSDTLLLPPHTMADFALAARDLGVGLIGACCGAQPHHVRAMAEALGKHTEVPAPEVSRSLTPAALQPSA